MAKLQLDGKKVEAVKKLISTAAATGDMGSKAGTIQGSSLPAFQGEKMPAGGKLNEVVITGKRKPKLVEMPEQDLIAINKDGSGNVFFSKQDIEDIIPIAKKRLAGRSDGQFFIDLISSLANSKKPTQYRVAGENKDGVIEDVVQNVFGYRNNVNHSPEYQKELLSILSSLGLSPVQSIYGNKTVK